MAKIFPVSVFPWFLLLFFPGFYFCFSRFLLLVLTCLNKQFTAGFSRSNSEHSAGSRSGTASSEIPLPSTSADLNRITLIAFTTTGSSQLYSPATASLTSSSVGNCFGISAGPIMLAEVCA